MGVWMLVVVQASDKKYHAHIGLMMVKHEQDGNSNVN